MKRNNKRMLAFSVLASLCLASSITALASEGWVQDGDEWRYLSTAGEAVSARWIAAGNTKYYLGDDGIMVREALTEINGRNYYFDNSGAMVTSQWVLMNEEEDTAWYYFGQDGKAYRHSESSFRKVINGKMYIFDEDGRMLTGWIDSDGNRIEDDNPFVEATYYCDEDGALYQGQWLKYVNGSEHDLESGVGGRVYGEYEEVWLYFDQNGKKIKSSSAEKATERTIGEKTYGFDENGVMVSWWGPATVVATTSNAELWEKTVKFYSGYDGGQTLKDTWIWMYPSEALSEKDYQDEEASWWRIGSNGQVLRNRIKTINGEKYAFDKIGRMQTGFVIFDGTKKFVGQYEVDAFESQDFIFWDPDTIIGIEGGDLYLFSANELNDGAMTTGRDIKVELSDGVFTFGFNSNGKAYGTRNQLQRNNNKFYINGLRLDADEDLKYGVVEAADKDGNDVYYVVNTQGTVQKGTKAIRDGYDGWFIIINGEFKAYLADGDKPKWHKGSEGAGFYFYDSANKENKYGEKIADEGTDAKEYLDALSDEGRLNFR